MVYYVKLISTKEHSTEDGYIQVAECYDTSDDNLAAYRILSKNSDISELDIEYKNSAYKYLIQTQYVLAPSPKEALYKFMKWLHEGHDKTFLYK